MVTINWLGVVAGTVLYQVLGALWFGPVFGRQWMTALGYESADDLGDASPTMAYLLTAVGAFVASLVLAFLVDWTGATTVVEGLSLGLLVGTGFVAAPSLQQVFFEERPPAVYALNVGYNIVALGLVGVLLVVV